MRLTALGYRARQLHNTRCGYWLVRITVNTDGVQRCGRRRSASRFCRLRFCYALVVGTALDAGRYCYALVVGTVLDAVCQHDARSSQYDLASPSFRAERR